MKSFNILLVFFVLNTTVSCLFLQAQEEKSEALTKSEQHYGEFFEPGNIKTGEAILETYQEIGTSDSRQMQLEAEVLSVCQVKGCWINLILENDEEIWVTFKDYSFFVPKDIAGRKVLVNGIAQLTEISEEDQKHFAKDAGKTEEEISKIKGVKKKYSLVADGVVLKE